MGGLTTSVPLTSSYTASLWGDPDKVEMYSGKTVGLVGSATLCWNADSKLLTVVETKGIESLDVEANPFMQYLTSHQPLTVSGPEQTVRATFEEAVGPFDVQVSGGGILNSDRILDNSQKAVRVQLTMPGTVLSSPGQDTIISVYFYRRTIGD